MNGRGDCTSLIIGSTAGVNGPGFEAHMSSIKRTATVERHPLILVLDDEESVGKLVRSALPHSTFRTIWVPTLDGAKRAIAENTPDLVIIDIGLQNENGLDLLTFLRSRRGTEHTPVV